MDTKVIKDLIYHNLFIIKESLIPIKNPNLREGNHVPSLTIFKWGWG